MIRTGPNPKKRLITRSTRGTGRRVIGVDKKMREPVMERHTAQWWEHEAKKSGAVHCTSCGAFFLKDHWLYVPPRSQRALQQAARPATCPACAAEKRTSRAADALGELTIRGIATVDRPQALQLIAAFAARTRNRNPEARILSVDASGAAIVVRTTQNQLAVRLGKKLDETMKGGALRIAYADDDLQARVTWTAPKR